MIDNLLDIALFKNWILSKYGLVTLGLQRSEQFPTLLIDAGQDLSDIVHEPVKVERCVRHQKKDNLLDIASLKNWI